MKGEEKNEMNELKQNLKVYNELLISENIELIKGGYKKLFKNKKKKLEKLLKKSSSKQKNFNLFIDSNLNERKNLSTVLSNSKGTSKNKKDLESAVMRGLNSSAEKMVENYSLAKNEVDVINRAISDCSNYISEINNLDELSNKNQQFIKKFLKYSDKYYSISDIKDEINNIIENELGKKGDLAKFSNKFLVYWINLFNGGLSKSLVADSSSIINIMITGYAGVGKSFISKKISSIIGISKLLLYGDVNTYIRSDLIGEYVGQTSSKTSKALISSLEKIFLVDEAYQIAGEKGANGYDQYGIECINTIVEYITEHDSLQGYIFIGYPYEMKTQFLDANTGMERRIKERIYLHRYEPNVSSNVCMGSCFSLNVLNNNNIINTLPQKYLQDSIKNLIKSITYDIENHIIGDNHTYSNNEDSLCLLYCDELKKKCQQSNPDKVSIASNLYNIILCMSYNSNKTKKLMISLKSILLILGNNKETLYLISFLLYKSLGVLDGDFIKNQASDLDLIGKEIAININQLYLSYKSEEKLFPNFSTKDFTNSIKLLEKLNGDKLISLYKETGITENFLALGDIIEIDETQYILSIAENEKKNLQLTLIPLDIEKQKKVYNKEFHSSSETQIKNLIKDRSYKKNDIIIEYQDIVASEDDDGSNSYGRWLYGDDFDNFGGGAGDDDDDAGGAGDDDDDAADAADTDDAADTVDTDDTDDAADTVDTDDAADAADTDDAADAADADADDDVDEDAEKKFIIKYYEEHQYSEDNKVNKILPLFKCYLEKPPVENNLIKTNIYNNYSKGELAFLLPFIENFLLNKCSKTEDGLNIKVNITSVASYEKLETKNKDLFDKIKNEKINNYFDILDTTFIYENSLEENQVYIDTNIDIGLNEINISSIENKKDYLINLIKLSKNFLDSIKKSYYEKVPMFVQFKKDIIENLDMDRLIKILNK